MRARLAAAAVCYVRGQRCPEVRLGQLGPLQSPHRAQSGRRDDPARGACRFARRVPPPNGPPTGDTSVPLPGAKASCLRSRPRRPQGATHGASRLSPRRHAYVPERADATGETGRGGGRGRWQRQGGGGRGRCKAVAAAVAKARRSVTLPLLLGRRLRRRLRRWWRCGTCAPVRALKVEGGGGMQGRRDGETEGRRDRGA